MKKTLTLLLLASLTFPAIAQDAKVGPQQRKKFRMGLNVSPSVDWFQTTTAGLDLEAVRVKFGAGLTGEYAFGNNYALTFGLEYKGAGGALAFQNAYYLSKEDLNVPFELKTRNYRYDYVNIPITMKLMTNEIGYFTYFAQVGVDLSILASAKGYDKGNLVSLDSLGFPAAFTPKDRDYRDIYSSSSFGQVRLRVGIGAEWNFSGNTSLVFSVTYHHGFIDMLRDADGEDIANEEGIYSLNDKNERIPFEMSANQHFVALNVGVLF
jgi:hypothetical protein